MNKKNNRFKFRSLDYALEQAKKVMEENNLKSLPSYGKLKELGHSTLASSISYYHKGYTEFRRLLGEDLRWGWKNLEYTIEQTKIFLEKYGFDYIPTQNKLRELGHSTLASSIVSYHGGFKKFRVLLGQNPTLQRGGRWKNLEYTIEQAKKVISENALEILPNQKNLGQLKHFSLVYAIARYHGGFKNFRRLLGEEVKWGRWKNLEYALEQAKKFMKEYGLSIFPNQKELTDRYSNFSLAYAIYHYHGGFKNFRRLLGENPKDWENKEYAVEQAKKVMKENNLMVLPSYGKLRELGHSSLASSISYYHKSYTEFRRLLGEEVKWGRWKNLEYALEQAKKVMEENNLKSLPSANELYKLKYFSLSSAIVRYHGGFKKFKKLLSKENF